MLCEFLSFYGGNELTFRYSILVVGEQKVLKRRILLTLHFVHIESSHRFVAIIFVYLHDYTSWSDIQKMFVGQYAFFFRIMVF